jgi:uncharacterized membrane protein (DUF2068 family)
MNLKKQVDMKVLCIDSRTDANSPLTVDLIEGAIYTVVDCVKRDGLWWYRLAEKSFFEIYTTDAFVPLSDIDETELINQKELSA